MIEMRKADQRGVANLGWLRSFHTFSFASYWDPEQVGFSDLLVINDDRVSAAKGFGTHPHRNMEIISYVLEGALEHRDSMGTGSVIVPGDIQLMSAGTGVTHSEFNHSHEEPVHFLQIWVNPSEKGTPPGYQQFTVTEKEKHGQMRLIVSGGGEGDALTIRQDIRIYSGLFNDNENTELNIPEGGYAYVHVARGRLEVNGIIFNEGDGVRVRDERLLSFARGENAEVLVF